jgi:hypothetical protein
LAETQNLEFESCNRSYPRDVIFVKPYKRLRKIKEKEDRSLGMRGRDGQKEIAKEKGRIGGRGEERGEERGDERKSGYRIEVGVGDSLILWSPRSL